MSDFLTLTGLRSGYDGSIVLRGIDLQVGTGEVVALLGRNGVGKSTLISTIMGLLRPYSGSVVIDGREYAGQRPDSIARAGVALVPQGRRVFAPLTVAEHLAIAARAGNGRASNGDANGASGAWTRERVLELLPNLGRRMNNRGNQLSGGEQQMLAIGRALLSNPRLLLLDEPSDGLAPSIVAQVGEVVHQLCSMGMSVLLVEQDLRLAFGASDRVAIMQKGKIVLDTTTADFRSDAARARSLLGVG